VIHLINSDCFRAVCTPCHISYFFSNFIFFFCWWNVLLWSWWHCIFQPHVLW